MISFYNDYNELAHPQILEDLMKLQDQINVGYGNDQHVLNAIEYVKKHIGRNDVDVHFIHGGTITNVIGLKTMLQSYEGVISCDTGHIIGHENGAIEAVGHQTVQVPNVNGKLTVENIKKALEAHSKEYSVKLKVVYISNATEFGTVYKKHELEAIHNFCKENDLYIYMDGARMATAMSSDYNDMTLNDIAKYCDVFTIGGTKNGMLMGEALVITNPEFSKGIRRTIKQRGALLAKGYLLGIQFETMFKENLYFELSDTAIEMAKYLRDKLNEMGIRLAFEQESNLVFPILSEDLAHDLASDFMFEIMDKVAENSRITRFVTRYSTTKEDIDALARKIEDFSRKRS